MNHCDLVQEVCGFWFGAPDSAEMGSKTLRYNNRVWSCLSRWVTRPPCNTRSATGIRLLGLAAFPIEIKPSVDKARKPKKSF